MRQLGVFLAVGALVACGAEDVPADIGDPTWSSGAGASTTLPQDLGPHFDGDGNLHIAVRSGVAERIEAWLYAEPFGAPERIVVALEPDADRTFRALVPRADLDALGMNHVYYGLRAWGPGWSWDPEWTPGSDLGFATDVDEEGNRFNPNKLLLDPYACETSHDPRNADHLDGAAYKSDDEHRTTDTAPFAPKGIAFRSDPAGAPDKRALSDQIVYEVHLRGFTRADESLPSEIRGTYAGAAAKAGYLADIGVTAIELLPLHETQNEQNDIDPASADGDNYWGYSSLSFFAPERRYAADKSPGGPTRELQEMVKTFHDHGIAVIVDVVFNHTAEGGALFLSWRGLDNAGYYQLGDEPTKYQNDNGVGPNISAKSELARDLVLDSLRYWHEDIGVDGFRFDLAPILANGCEHGCFDFDGDDPNGILQRAVSELPNAWLIAEPWGVGAGTYQIGNFPDGWAEWNGKYRDTIRDDQNRMNVADVTPGWLANRLSGSWELFGDDDRAPWSSINFVVAHDGLVHRDLYSCNDKNNNQPWPFGPSDGGSTDNRAWNQAGDPSRQRQAARTGLALLMVSAGVPMITGGDEMYRTQKCNNNPYNLDSPGMWLDWSNLDSYAPHHHFARELMRFRNAHPALRPQSYRLPSAITFYRADGVVADAIYLDNADNHFLAFQLDGEEAGDSVRSIFIAYNGGLGGIDVTLPETDLDWYLVSDTHAWLEPEANFMVPGTEPVVDEATYLLGSRALLILIER